MLNDNNDDDRNLDVCDMINETKDGSSIAVSSIIQRLRKYDAKITSLTISLSLCCAKNCEKSFPQALTQAFFDEIINISSGKLGSQLAKDAIRFLEELYTDYSKFNVKIKDAYECLSAKGLLSDRVMAGGSE